MLFHNDQGVNDNELVNKENLTFILTLFSPILLGHLAEVSVMTVECCDVFHNI